MLNHSKYLVLGVAAVAAGILGTPAPQARADVILYATGNLGQTAGQISMVDVTTNVVTPYNTPSGDDPDSLIFANTTTILYTNFDNSHGQLRKINADGTGVGLVIGGFNGPADLTLMPNGVDVLVSDFSGGVIWKVANPLTSPVMTTFATTTAVGPNGIVFTPNGNLYANLGTRDSGTAMSVNRLDPTTGAVLGTSALFPGLDGLTYDSVTGNLFATERYNSKLLEINPTTLATTELTFTDALGGSVSQLDGLESDGVGDLFIASNVSQRIYEYRISDGAILWTSPIIPHLDDIVPLIGLGSSGTPEPASLGLLALGLTGLMIRRHRR